MSSRRHGPCLSRRKAGDFLFKYRLAGYFPSAFVTIALLCAVIGCSRPKPDEAGSRPKSGQRALIVYSDGLGRKVELPTHPQRIISLAPSVTETLFLLGAGDRVIGVTTNCDWPDSAKSRAKIGDLLNPNYELILAAKPDLIIASTAGNDRTAVLRLSDLGLPVYVTAPRSVEKIFETVENIGRIADCAGRGEQLVAQMKARLDGIRRRLAGLPPTRAFFITWFDPLLSPGKSTFETDVLRHANVDSITANIDEFYPRYSLEQVLARDPDVIITVEHTGSPLPDLRRIAGWKDLRAVKQNRIYVLKEVFQHPSPRFVDGVEELARKLHPERFR
ncbi:MAG TPA: cobalamin-binding protein [Acidobacteriota bacterium]|nr:cobalamin-binding protein [Acidobacteriota bacterium]